MRYVKDSRTSYEAAIDNLPRLGGQQQRILSELLRVEDDGLTRDEIEVVCELSGNAVRPRCKELLEAGLIEETDRQRRTRSGSQAYVLVATNSGVGSDGCLRQPVTGESQTAVTTDSGVEASVPVSRPSGGTEGSSRPNPYEAEVWAE